TMGVDVGDYDGDGRADIFVTSFSDDTPTLYRNLGGWQFEDLTFQARLGRFRQYVGWAALFVDLDLDGWKDLFIVNGHIYPQVDRYPMGLEYRQSRQLYRNLGNGAFDDLTAAAGPAIRRKAAGRGAAAEDFDGDGQLELVVANSNDTPSYLRNQRPRAGNWLIVEPHGIASNRSAIGARVEVRAGGRVQKGEVRSSRGYYSSSGLRVHFGLGGTQKLDEVRIFWPSGRESTLRGVSVNRVLAVREPEQ
ncbi:MAG: RNA-binding protein, partial [Acidobacteria bacterium]